MLSKTVKLIMCPKRKVIFIGLCIIIIGRFSSYGSAVAKNADQILVVESGKILERGTNDELILAEGKIL